jgi:hypothetical protein
VTRQLQRRDFALKGGAEVAPLTALGLRSANGQRNKDPGGDEGGQRATHLVEAAEVEQAIVEAVGDDDVVGFIAVLCEANDVALVAGDAFGAQGGAGPAEIGLLQPQVLEPLGELG